MVREKNKKRFSEGEEEMRDLDTEDKDSPYLPEEM